VTDLQLPRIVYRGQSTPLRLSRKIALSLEIVALYFKVRLLLLRKTLPEALDVLRSGRLLAQPLEPERLHRAFVVGKRMAHLLEKVPADSRCLVRSCVLVALLSRRGIGATLVIGVCREPTFEAHAWVESAGVPLLDPGEWRSGRLTEL
jgi:hypothetical protein